VKRLATAVVLVLFVFAVGCGSTAATANPPQGTTPTTVMGIEKHVHSHQLLEY